MRLCIMPGMPTHLLQELNVGTVCCHTCARFPITFAPSVQGSLHFSHQVNSGVCVSMTTETTRDSQIGRPYAAVYGQ